MEKVETQLFPVRELKHKFESKRDIYKALKYQSKWTSVQTIVLVKLCLPSFRKLPVSFIRQYFRGQKKVSFGNDNL